MDDSNAPDPNLEQPKAKARTGNRFWSRTMIVIRRIHLYSGLFLLPWVFLYGITGAMYNHMGLFPEAEIRPVEREQITASGMPEFPSSQQLAAQVIEALQAEKPELAIKLHEPGFAEFTGDLIYETWHEGKKTQLHLSPLGDQARIVVHPEQKHDPEKLLTQTRNVKLEQNPLPIASQSAQELMTQNGIPVDRAPNIVGWTKLNFLAEIDGTPARITYVLKDGHIDANEYNEKSGFSPRRFFMRLHTTHHVSPYWNGRTIWVLFADTMAIAMVCWGISGLLMWWQIKRTRLWGGLFLLASVGTSVAVYYSVLHFYTTTRL